MDTNEFLEQVYTAESDHAALDLVFEAIDNLLDGLPFQAIDDFMVEHGCEKVLGVEAREPNFAAVDALLAAVDVERCTITRMLSFLSSPFPARDQLTQYKPLLARVRTCLKRTESRNRVKALLQGFDR